MRIAATLLFLILGGCASTPTINCPPLVPYTLLQNQVLADELPKDGTQSQIVIEDYAKLRSACRNKK